MIALYPRQVARFAIDTLVREDTRGGSESKMRACSGGQLKKFLGAITLGCYKILGAMIWGKF